MIPGKIERNSLKCVNSVRIRSYSGPHFPAFWLNTERFGVPLRVQSEYGKMRNRITPNTDIFYAVLVLETKFRDDPQITSVTASVRHKLISKK